MTKRLKRQEFQHVGELSVRNPIRECETTMRVLASEDGVRLCIHGVGNIDLSPERVLVLAKLARIAITESHGLRDV